MPAQSPPSTDNVDSPLAGLLPAVALSLLVLIAGVVGFYAPPARGEMAVVFPVGTSEQTAFHLVLGAGGRFVGPSHLPNIIVAYADDSQFAERIRTAGALFLLAAHGLCGPQLPSESE